MRVRLLAYAALLWLLVAQPAWAVDIDIRHTDGTKSPWGGTGAVGDVTMATLFSGEDQINNLLMTSGGAVRSTTMASAVATNTTSAVISPPIGSKSIQGILTCNAGAATNCGITFTVYGSFLNTQATGTKETLCTATIPTGAAVTSAACPVITAAFPYLWTETTGVAGTSPSLTVYIGY